jgi:hypothetical protein
MRHWEDVRAELFAGREGRIAAAQDQLRLDLAAGHALTADPVITPDDDQEDE